MDCHKRVLPPDLFLENFLGQNREIVTEQQENIEKLLRLSFLGLAIEAACLYI